MSEASTITTMAITIMMTTNPGAVALTFIFGIVIVGSAIAFYAGARRKMDLEQWTVAGRGFGLI